MDLIWNPLQWMAVACLYAILLWVQATYYGMSVWDLFNPGKWEEQ